MPKLAYVTRATVNGVDITSIVVDKEEFDALVAELVERGITTREQAAALVDAGSIPAAKRGTKTAFIFERYNVQTDLLGMVVRGRGLDALKRILQ